MSPDEAADRRALHDLVIRYARIPDDRDYPLVDAVFARDAVLEGPGFTLEGRDQIRAGMQAIEQYERTLHSMHNHAVEIAGDAARGETYCVANHIFQKDGRATKLDWGIRYRDEFRREADGWRIARRALNLVWEQELPLRIENP